MQTAMNAKLEKLSELANILSSENSLRNDLFTLFARFGLGRLLCRLSLEKQKGVSAVQLILSLCLFRVCSETVHSIYDKRFYDLLDTGKNCYYRMMNRASMNWRRLLMYMAVRFQAILRTKHANSEGLPKCYILDDTTLEKTGMRMEHISRVYDHVKHVYVLGYKLLLCAFFDGKSTLPIDFSLHCEKGKNGDYGLSSKQRKARFSKKRDKTCPNYTRAEEVTQSKLDVAIEMLKRAWKHKPLRAEYVLCDSWFTCERLIAEVRKIGKGAMHFVGLAKMGNRKYLVDGKKYSAAELVTKYERNSKRHHNMHTCRKYKCLYISLRGKIGEQDVRIFLVKYGRNTNWNILLTSDTEMSFLKAFEIYQIRWNIEVLNKETKQYLKLGQYQGRDFDGQIADCTICYLTYIVMALEKRFSDYETMGELFACMEDDLRALTLWKRILACLRRLLEVLGEELGLTFEKMAQRFFNEDKTARLYLLMIKELEEGRAEPLTA
jgi:hypothetical protein